MQFKEIRRTVSKEIGSVGSFSEYSCDVPRMLFSLKPGTEILFIEEYGGLGDILSATAFFRGVKERYPHLKIVFATQLKYFDLLINNPHIDRLIQYTPGMDRFDFLFSVNLSTVGSDYECRQNGHILESRSEIYCKYFELPITKYLPVYNVLSAEILYASNFFKRYSLENKKVIAIALRSSEQYKDLPIETYKELLTLCEKDKNFSDVFFLIFDTTLQVTWFNKNFISISNLNIREVAALLSNCKVLLTVDSGLLHLAGALNVSILFFYGISSKESRIGLYKNSLGLTTANLDCIPCWRGKNLSCKKIADEKKSKTTSYCLEQIRALDIKQALLSFI